jgi:outer membrane protein OmpA-like peptidoglycan-associated protein
MNTRVRYRRSLFLLSLALFFAAVAAAQVQTGPITEPRSAAHEPAGPPVAKGAAAITRQQEKCSTRLIVNADALFAPHRWTLNHDASETLDVLGPMIVKAGKHPTRILAETDAAELDSENRDVSQRRALTVRTWLVNHRFIAEGTPIEAVGSKAANMARNQAQSAEPVREPSKNGTVDVLVGTCH